MKKFLKRKSVIDNYMKGAPFVRLVDKLSFILGVLLLIFTTYIMGRYPDTHYYTFHCVAVITLVIFRFYNYRSKGWHYYLFDFCYYGNTIMIIFLTLFPKDDILFKVFFVYANGPFGLAIPAFKNSMIFHKIDNLISCSIHLIPQVTSWNLKWHTLPAELEKPESDRYFLTLDALESNNILPYLTKMFLIPLGLYLLWAFLYSLKIFVISSKRIQERNYETMYIYYMNQAWAKRILSRFGLRFAPLVFMSLHVTFFIFSSIFAILAYNSFYLHTILMLMWITLSIWNGANFYMEYFSKKYEANLKRLEEIEVTLSIS